MSYAPALRDLLPPAHILLQASCQNKKRAFEQATTALENLSGLARNELFRQFMHRERQGSTSIGYYGAIPHLRMEIEKPLCLLVRLKKPIQYDADHAPTSQVHTLFFLVAPEGDSALHLNLLSVFSHLLADEGFMEALTGCGDAEAAHGALIDWETRNRTLLDEIFSSQ